MIETMAGRVVSPILIGRTAEMATIERAIEASLAAHPVHLLISGEAGIGKSRLVQELARSAAARGMRVARGACSGLGDGAMPYGAIVEALRGLARDLDPVDLAAAVGPSGPDLGRLVPALAPTAAGDPTIQRDMLQVRLVDALLGLVQRLAASQPLLLVIEDLHWADPATRDVVAFLTRNLAADRVLLAMTFRSDELHRRHPLLPWLAELERTGGIERVGLRRLHMAETAALVSAITGKEPIPDLTERIHRRSDGNPFFVEELLLADHAATGSGRMPPTLRDVLLARIADVPEATRVILGVAAVAGRRVDHDLLSTIAGQPEATMLEALRSAVSSQILVVETEDRGADAYAFRHALLQEIAYEDLLPGERKRLHRACAAAIAARPAGDGAAAAAHWAELAHHWSAANDDPAAFDASLRAAEAAERTFAFTAALRQYERLLDLWTDVPDPGSRSGVDRATILERAARVAFLAGDESRAVALSREAIATVDPAEEPVRSAVLLEGLGRGLWGLGETGEALVAYEAAVALMPIEPPTAERARVLAGFGQMLMLLDRWIESHRQCDEAIAVARRVGARQAEGHAMNTLGLDLVAEGRTEDGVASIENALAIALDLRNADDVGRAYVNLADARFFAGDLEGAAAAIDEGVRVAEAFGVTSSYGCFIRETGVLINYDLGRWQVASRLATESFAIDRLGADQSRYGLARWVSLLVATGAPEATDRLDRLEDLIRGGPPEYQFSGPYYAARAELEMWHGRPGDALETVRRGLAHLSRKKTWFWHVVRLHRIGARAAADVAEVARARRDRAGEQGALADAAELRESRAGTVAASLAVQSGRAADETRAEAATADAEDTRLLGTPDPGAWREALTRWRARERPYLVAYVRWREAEACLAVGDRAGAADALDEAAAVAGDLGARPLLEAIDSLAARSRIRLGQSSRIPPDDDDPAPAGASMAEDPFGLTEREREVLGLVALGRTNRQIGGELFISANTAGVHVSNILGKMGASSRAEAAGIAVRLGLAADR
jgi:DNA-binding NarL/FixJ family response regulator